NDTIAALGTHPGIRPLSGRVFPGANGAGSRRWECGHQNPSVIERRPDNVARDEADLLVRQ
ncbi:MAG TPA: hypothetical protein VK784_06605, partial [Pseudonocardiaceae bacterium]|nr:hypothetical protein [Pseudonocardiaceae bacterium]